MNQDNIRQVPTEDIEPLSIVLERIENQVNIQEFRTGEQLRNLIEENRGLERFIDTDDELNQEFQQNQLTIDRLVRHRSALVRDRANLRGARIAVQGFGRFNLHAVEQPLVRLGITALNIIHDGARFALFPRAREERSFE